VIEAPPPSNEGIVDLNAPPALPNEEDVTLADMRNARDLAIYAGTAPSFDPLLLEAQETNPVFSTIEGHAFDPDPGDFALELWPSARLASNWSNHALEIRARYRKFCWG